MVVAHETERLITVSDPATEDVLAVVEAIDPEGVRRAEDRARAAQPAWAALGWAQRRTVFRRCHRWLMASQRRLVASIVAENGKPAADALIEVVYCAAAFEYWGRMAPRYLRDARIRSFSPFILGRRMHTRREPVGVVGVIGPWNNPLLNSFGDAVPALAAGNAVLLKPSEHTPLTPLVMLEMAAECGLPDDLFQVLPGEAETGEAVVDVADYVMFTGSTRTGRQVAARAAERLIPVSLELGGKDALVVLADAPLERAVNVAVYGALFNGGQACTSIERVYVEEAIHDRFVAAVVGACRRLRVGAGDGLGSTDVGALTFPPQLEIIDEHVRDAVERGARVLTGGHRLARVGRFYPPTVLVDVDHSMKCMREETFGPTLPIMKVRDADHAVELVNDSEYGLQASIVSRNAGRAARLAERLRVGAVTVNDTQSNFLALGLPMGGWRQSGIGVRHGAEGIRKYTRNQSISVNARPLRRDPHMMPYQARSYRLIARLASLLYGRRC